MSDVSRHFLFLQGPHGSFFSELAQSLNAAGHRTSRVGFNQGDARFWDDPSSYIAFQDPLEEWPDAVRDLLADVTDLVVYGDTRPLHATAIEAAKQLGVTVHSFEEGYLRPYWITYERDGNNGNSKLMGISLEDMERALAANSSQLVAAPAQWGPMWHHTWAGCDYHFNILFRNGDYPHYKPHRAASVKRELALHIRRLALFPLDSVRRRAITRALFASAFPYHLVLLQLSHDAAVQDHSDYSSMSDFAIQCIEEFAEFGPKHHRLVFKAHPLEDGREPLARLIAHTAAKHGLENRVIYVPGGKLGPLLDRASSTVTINSTAGQQALWRGLPLKAFGRGVYCRAGLISSQALGAFYAAPKAPNRDGYRIFRQFLLETSQIGGGYYTSAGRANARRQVIDMMLAPLDPYQMRMADLRAHLRLVEAEERIPNRALQASKV